MGSQQENQLRSAQGRDWPAGTQAGTLVTITYQWRHRRHLQSHSVMLLPLQSIFCLGSASEDVGL